MRFTTVRNAIAGICIIATLFFSFSNEHPIGNTGAPIDGLCSDCHSPSGNFSASMNFQFNDYGANSDIFTDINVGDPARYGFQIAALDDNNAQVGTFTVVPSDASVQIDGSTGVEYLGHNPSVFSSGGNWATEAGWDPQGFTGDVHFYVAWMVTNDDGTNSGDDVFFDEFVYTIGSTVLPLDIEIVESTDPLCNGDDNGFAVAEVSGGVMPYEYLWSNGEDGETAFSLAAGVHSVTVTDDAGSTAVAEVELEDPAELSITSDQGPTDCFGSDEGFIEVTAMGGTGTLSYDWGVFGDACCLYDLPAAFYTITVTDENDCSYIETFEILEPSELVVMITSTPISLGNTMDGTATASASGGTAPYEYEWSNGIDVASIINLTAGTYTVTVTDDNDCETIESVTILEGITCDLELTVDAQPPLCFPDTIGTLSLTISGGIAPYDFLWEDGSNGMSFTGVAGTSYSVSVSDALGCSLTQELFLAQPDSLTVLTQLLVPNSCPSDNAGVLLVDVSGGVGDYTLTWSNGLTNDTTILGLDTLVNIPDSLFNLPDGFISYELVDANGCTKVDTFLITNNDNVAPVLVLESGTVYLDEMGVNASPLPNLLGGSFDNCGIATVDILGQQDFTCADIGVRTVMVEVSDVSGNISVGTTTLLIVDEIAPTITCPDNMSVATCLPIDYELPMTQDNCDGNVEVTLKEGFVSGEVFPAGITTVIYTARDACGNESDCSFIVEVLSDLEAQASTTPADCGVANGTMTTLATGGTPPYSYSVINVNQTGLPAGDYEVVVSDSNGCSAIAQGTVASVGGLYESNRALEFIICEGDTTALAVDVDAGVPPYVYSIDGGVEEISTDGIIEILDPTLRSSLTILVTDAAGCDGTLLVEIIEILDAPLITQTVVLSCGQNSIPVGDIQIPIGLELEDNVATLGPGDYNLIYTSAHNSECEIPGALGGTLIVENAAEMIVNASVVNSSCSVSDGVISMSTTGGLAPYSYVPFGPVQGGLGAGNYSITVSDAAGCSTETTVQITQVNAPTLIVTESFICHEASDGEIGLEAQGGTPPYEYFLGFISQTTPIDGPFTIQNLEADGYNVRVVDAAGCEARSTAVVRSHPELIAELVYEGAECDFDPMLLVPEISGGILPYVPVIAESTTDPGIWILTVTDAADCQVISSYDAQSDAPLNATFDIAYDCDGSFITDVFVSGGCPPYMFSNALSDLPGDHQLIVTDANGDSFMLDYQILDIDPMVAAVDVEPVSDIPGLATSQIEGGLAPYTYVWLNEQGDTLSREADLIDISFTMPQDVTFIVTDDLGCMYSVTVTVDVISAVNELLETKTFEIFPNPVNDLLTLRDPYHQEALIFIYDHKGQKITDLTKLNDKTVVNIPTTLWAAGLYYIRIVTELGTEVFQIIKI